MSALSLSHVDDDSLRPRRAVEATARNVVSCMLSVVGCWVWMAVYLWILSIAMAWEADVDSVVMQANSESS